MSASVAAARAALVSAVGATDGPLSPPCLAVVSGGSELRGLGGGNVEWTFRVVCYAGAYTDNAGLEDALGALVQSTLVTLRSLAGWSIVSVSPSLIRDADGGRVLAADIAVTTSVTLT
jgi:hypothetical protein